jgi:HEAT repeat protein
VRRTAGDALSDIGDVAAQPAICRALRDSNKLVRWRAARFLSDVGTQDALPFLEQAADDPEFEVRLEIEAAMQRIRGGSEGIGPAWKRIVEQA